MTAIPEAPNRLAQLAQRLAGPLLLLVGVFGASAWMEWPDVRTVARERPTTIAVIAQAEAASGVDIRLDWADLRDVSPHLALAVLVAEDIEFFQHRGFSWAEMRFAVQDARAGGRVRGASTITQQLAKNLWLTPSRSPFRKLREFVLTRQLEQHLSKRRILEIYLNVAQFGPEIYGAEAAARSYFRVPADSLTTDQAAQLAAGLPRPSTWHPGVSTKGYNKAVSRIRLRAGQCDWLDWLL